MNKEKTSLNQKIINSKVSFTKNFLYYLIVPALILVIGIVLLFTVGFNLGLDYAGGTSFKIYTNNEAIISDANSYNLDKNEEYDIVYNKVKTILDENGLSIASYSKSSINIYDYNVFNGQAVEVKYLNTSLDKSDIETTNNKVRNGLIEEFGYQNFEKSVSDFDINSSLNTLDWVIGIVAAIVFVLIVTIIYMALRYNKSASLVVLLQVALDLFMVIGLILICRITTNLTFGITLFVTLIISIFNLFYYYNTLKENFKSGKYEKMNNSNIADLTTKETMLKKSIVYIILALISVLFAAIAVGDVRDVALGIIVSLVVTFYTSQLILPTIWATLFKNKKKLAIKK